MYKLTFTPMEGFRSYVLGGKWKAEVLDDYLQELGLSITHRDTNIFERGYLDEDVGVFTVDKW